MSKVDGKSEGDLEMPRSTAMWTPMRPGLAALAKRSNRATKRRARQGSESFNFAGSLSIERG